MEAKGCGRGGWEQRWGVAGRREWFSVCLAGASGRGAKKARPRRHRTGFRGAVPRCLRGRAGVDFLDTPNPPQPNRFRVRARQCARFGPAVYLSQSSLVCACSFSSLRGCLFVRRLVRLKEYVCSSRLVCFCLAVVSCVSLPFSSAKIAQQKPPEYENRVTGSHFFRLCASASCKKFQPLSGR